MSNNYKCGFWYKTIDVFSSQNDRWSLIVFQKIPSWWNPTNRWICHTGGGSVRCVLPWVRLLLSAFQSGKKGDRWSGAREILAWWRWRKGKLSPRAPRRRTLLSFGVTCACAFTRFHLVPWLLSSFLLSVACPSLDVALGEWRGTGACNARAALPDTRNHSDQT